MVDVDLIRNLGIIIVAAAFFAFVARAIKIPTIVAYLMAGLAVGPLTRLVEITEPLELISEAGVALLLFLVGLEMSFNKVRDVGKTAIVAGIFQVTLTALGAFGIGLLLGFTTRECVFLALALSFSSTVVVVKMLAEKEELNSVHGRIAIGILLVQDLIAIITLTFLSGVDATLGATPITLLFSLLRSFGGMALLLVITLFVARHVLPRPFAWAASSPDTLLIASLAWCFLLAIAAESLHLSLEIGAFLAGLALAQLPWNQELHRRVHPLMNLFVAVFLVSLGINMEVHPDRVDWIAAVLLALYVVVIKPALLIAVVSRMGCSMHTAFKTGITLSQISEFSFILLALAVSAGYVGPELLAVVGATGLVGFAASSYLFNNMARLFKLSQAWGLLRLLGNGHDALPDEPLPQRAGHVIVIGMNTLGREIVLRLHKLGEEVLAIDTDADNLQNLPCETLLGSVEYVSLLLEAGLPRAKLVVSALMVEEANDLLAFRCTYFGVPSSIHAIDVSVIDNLLKANTTYLMLPKVDGIKWQTRELRRLGFIK